MEIIRLKELIKYKEGYVNPSINNKEYFGGKIPWARVKDIKHGSITKKTELNLTKIGFESEFSNRYLFKKGTILWVKSGSVGRVSIAGVDLAANRGILNLIPDIKKIHNKYLFFWLLKNSQIFEKLAQGSVLKHLYGPNLIQQKITLPSLEKQQEIIDIIEPLENKKNKLKIIISELIRLGELKYLKDESLINNKLSNLTSLKTGKTPRTLELEIWKDASESWIDSGSISNNVYIDRTDFKKKVSLFAVESNKVKVISGLNILMGDVEPALNKISLSDDTFSVSNHVIYFSIEKLEWIYFAIRINMKKINNMKKGSVIKQVSKTDLGQMDIKIPINEKGFKEIINSIILYSKQIKELENDINLLIKKLII